MRSAPTVATSSGVPARPAGLVSIMARNAAPLGALSSSRDIGVTMTPGLMALIRAPSPPHRFRTDAQCVPGLGELVGVQGIEHGVGLQHRQRHQLLHRGCRQLALLFGGQRGQDVPGLRGDDHP